MKNQQNMHAIVWLSRTMGKKKLYIVYLVVLQALLGAASVLSALLFRSLIDGAVSGDTHTFFRAVLWMAALMLTRITLNAVGSFLYEWIHSTVENQFKERLFSCLLHKSYRAVTAIHSGEWMNRLTSDTSVVTSGMIDIIPGLTGMATRLIGALAAIFLLEPMFTAILIPGGIFILLFTYGFRKVLKRLHKRIREADGGVRVFLQERLGSLMIVRTFGMERQTEEEAREKMRLHKEARIRRNILSDFCNFAFGAAANGVYLFGAAYCGYGILKGELSYGTMMAVLQLISQVQSPFANITGFLPRYYAMIASAERLMEAEGYEEDCAEEPVGTEEILRFYREEFQGMGLKGAGFTYQAPPSDISEGGNTAGQKDISEKEDTCPDQEKPGSGGSSNLVVLEGIDLKIRKGEYVAFTGHSGCGKSTILKLLMSLYPLDSGERYLVSRHGRMPLTARWRGLFAYVPQGSQLMSGTIREIITLGDREAMKQEASLERALRIACADEFVPALEHGLDTVLGERGSGLSEGQMQRIAIARAVFSDHPILMLDESTSALDEATEQKLLANLKAMTDKTVLIVTHRPAVLGICDKRMIVTDGNCIQEDVGNPRGYRTDTTEGGKMHQL